MPVKRIAQPLLFYAFENSDTVRCSASDGQGFSNVFLSVVPKLEQSGGKNTFQNFFLTIFVKSLIEGENLS